MNRLGERDLALPAPARRQPGRLVALVRRGVRRGPPPGRAGADLGRLRGLPLVSRDGARVVRGPRRRQADQRRLRGDQGGPRGAARRRRRLHDRDAGDDRAGRLADDGLRDARRRPVLLRHLLPEGELHPAARARSPPPGRTSARRCSSRAPRWSRRSAAPSWSAGPTAPISAEPARRRRRAARQGPRSGVRRVRRRPEVPAAHEPAVPAAPPPAHRVRRRPWRSSGTPASRWPGAASTTSWPAASPGTRWTTPGPCRTSRRCCTTTRCCCACTPSCGG